MARYSIRLYMYIDRYSTNRPKIDVTLHRATEAVSLASEQPLNRDHIRDNPFRFSYRRECPLEHSKVSKQLPFGFRVTLPSPRNNLVVPGLGTAPKSQSPCFHYCFTASKHPLRHSNFDNIMILCPNHHRIVHACHGEYHRRRREIWYPNGLHEPLRLNLHL